ncbi:MAG: glycerophosphatase [Acidimicrobiia bacterium]|nr:glycerophosphatase [Acidimicrobiia bacterium]
MLANPKAGTDVADLLPSSWKLETMPPTDLVASLQEFVDQKVTAIGVAGGDGTQRCAAEVLAGTSTALAVIPGGTRNHFAHLLGTGTMEAVEAAVKANVTERVDIGRCDEQAFVNNATFGWYTDFVQSRDELVDRGLSKKVAHWLAPMRLLRQHRDLHVQLAGVEAQTWMVWIGNGEFGLTATTLNSRPLPTTGMLDVRFVRSDARLAKLRVLFGLLFRRLERSPLLVRTVTPAVRLRFDSRRVSVALDGELVEVKGDIQIHTDPGQLLVFIGADVVRPEAAN